MTTIEKIEKQSKKADKEHEEAKEKLRQWKEVWGVRLNYLMQNSIRKIFGTQFYANLRGPAQICVPVNVRKICILFT